MAASPSVLSNPFRDSVLGDPWINPLANVAQIGLEAFSLYRREVDAVRQEGVSRSILFYGASGSGKTHLIGRVRRHLEERSKSGWLTGVFVTLRMQTPPTRIWRHLRRRLVEDLLRKPADGPSQLDRLIFRNLAEPASRGQSLDEWKAAMMVGQVPYRRDDLAMGLYTIVRKLEEAGTLQTLTGGLFEVLAGDEKLSFELMRVLQHYTTRHHLALVHGWLRGDSLAEADLATLGLKPTPDEEDPEGASRDLVLSLVRLIGRGTPTVFCFDQLEALRPVPSDTAGFYAFGSMASALHDETENSLLISCIMSDFVEPLKGVTGSNYARIAGVQRALPGLTYDQAEKLIKARLSLAPAHSAASINMDDVRKLFSERVEVTARKVLAHAAQLFDRQPVIPVDQFISQSWEDHLQRAENTDTLPGTDQILEYGIPVLLRLEGRVAASAPGSPDLQLVMRSAEGTTGISLCNQKNMTAFASRLRRLKAAPSAQFLLVRDPRLPIPKTAERTWVHLEDLTASGTRLVRPSLEAISALEALRTLLSEAQAGDLAHDGETISASTVEEWLSAHLPSALRQFAQELTADPEDKSITLREALIELLASRYLVPTAEAARKLGCKEQELKAVALQSAASIGYLAGPPGLLFQPVSGGAV